MQTAAASARRLLRQPIGAYAQALRQLLDQDLKVAGKARIKRWVRSASVQEKIAGYLESKMPRARNLALADFVHSAGGWSHEIYLFYANWNEDGRAMRQGFCLRKDPGAGLVARAFEPSASSFALSRRWNRPPRRHRKHTGTKRIHRSWAALSS